MSESNSIHAKNTAKVAFEPTKAEIKAAAVKAVKETADALAKIESDEWQEKCDLYIANMSAEDFAAYGRVIDNEKSRRLAAAEKEAQEKRLSVGAAALCEKWNEAIRNADGEIDPEMITKLFETLSMEIMKLKDASSPKIMM